MPVLVAWQPSLDSALDAAWRHLEVFCDAFHAGQMFIQPSRLLAAVFAPPPLHLARSTLDTSGACAHTLDTCGS